MGLRERLLNVYRSTENGETGSNDWLWWQPVSVPPHLAAPVADTAVTATAAPTVAAAPVAAPTAAPAAFTGAVIPSSPASVAG